MVQETQSAHFLSIFQPQLNLTTSFPQKMHRFAASSQLDHMFFSRLNCTQIKLHPRSVLCHVISCQVTRKRCRKECSGVHPMHVWSSYFSWRAGGRLAHQARQVPLEQGLQNCSPHFASQQPRRHLALTQMPAHTLTQRVSKGRAPPPELYLQPFSPPGASGTDLALAKRPSQIGLRRAYWICPEKQSKNLPHPVHS